MIIIYIVSRLCRTDTIKNNMMHAYTIIFLFHIVFNYLRNGLQELGSQKEQQICNFILEHKKENPKINDHY